jgi:quercetin dioxygenase-like cupin family protein
MEIKMLLARNSDVNAINIKAIEGQTVYGGNLMVKPMMMGDEMTIMEITYTPGVGAPMHKHTHESLVYVVKGKVKTVIEGDGEYVLGPGDVCRHPAGLMHTVEALEDAMMIEIKAPASDFKNFFKV